MMSAAGLGQRQLDRAHSRIFFPSCDRSVHPKPGHVLSASEICRIVQASAVCFVLGERATGKNVLGRPLRIRSAGAG